MWAIPLKGACMTEQGPESEEITPEIARRALKAFKKRLKLTALDYDSNLGKGPFSKGAQGICAIMPPNQYPPAVWDELVRQGKLRSSGHGMYELNIHPV
jgi:hypothetical protein